MTWLVAGAVYLVIHLMLYLAVLRHLRRFSTERAIFLYHALSFVPLSLLLLGNLILERRDAPIVVILWCLHGIYSLSFLELWSLAQGGYSLQILASLHRSAGDSVDLNRLAQVGDVKKAARLEGLQKLKLLRRKGTRVEIAPLGKLVAAGLRMVVLTANVTKAG